MESTECEARAWALCMDLCAIYDGRWLRSQAQAVYIPPSHACGRLTRLCSSSHGFSQTSTSSLRVAPSCIRPLTNRDSYERRVCSVCVCSLFLSSLSLTSNGLDRPTFRIKMIFLQVYKCRIMTQTCRENEREKKKREVRMSVHIQSLYPKCLSTSKSLCISEMSVHI